MDTMPVNKKVLKSIQEKPQSIITQLMDQQRTAAKKKKKIRRDKKKSQRKNR